MDENSSNKSRGIKKRIVVEAMLELTSPTHLGGTDPIDILDMPIARDIVSGKPILYGTTLAGLLRGALSDRIKGPLSNEPPEVFTFFGGSNGTDTSNEKEDVGKQSPFIVDDAVCEEDVRTEIRDGVAIDPESGVAIEGAKFDMELLPAGSDVRLGICVIVIFPVFFEIVLG